MAIGRDITRYGISRRAAAERARVAHGVELTPQALAHLATRGIGPVYRRIAGVCYYPIDTFDTWCEARVGKLITRASDRWNAPAPAASEVAA